MIMSEAVCVKCNRVATRTVRVRVTKGRARHTYVHLWVCDDHASSREMETTRTFGRLRRVIRPSGQAP